MNLFISFCKFSPENCKAAAQERWGERHKEEGEGSAGRFPAVPSHRVAEPGEPQ